MSIGNGSKVTTDSIAESVVSSHMLPAATSRTGQLADWFAEAIRSGRYRAGQQLPTEQELVANFGVSRTVLREAMASLKADGLVVSRQGIGVFVAHSSENSVFRITPAEVRSDTELKHILQLRSAVEAEAVEIAAVNRTAQDLKQMRRWLDTMETLIAEGDSAVAADFEFHRAISAATGNPYFERFMYFLGPVMIPRKSSLPSERDSSQQQLYLKKIQHEHQLILDAIERRDPHTARRIVREHLNLEHRGLDKSAVSRPPRARQP